MKRSEIHVGDTLYYDRSTNWQTYTGDARKAVVIDNEAYTITRRAWGKDTYHKDPRGKAVLVQIDGYAEPTAVPTTHLRGPYEATKAEAEKVAEARRQERAAESKKTVDAWAAGKAIEDRAKAAGVNATVTRIQYVDGPMMVLSPADLTKLLDAYTR